MWTWNIHDLSFRCTVDSCITKAFRELKYDVRTSDDYLNSLGGTFSQKPDMTHSFFGANGCFAVCFRCAKEQRGLHIHVCANNDDAYKDLEKVERHAGNPALKVASLKSIISDLTWNHKLTVLSVIFALLGGVLNITVQSAFTLTILLSIIYLVAVLSLMILRAFYASKLIRSF
jgi:hypothetical protein